MQSYSWSVAGLLLAVAAASGIAEHRRRKRADLDAVGWVPWVPIQFAALFCALIAVSLALHGVG